MRIILKSVAVAVVTVFSCIGAVGANEKIQNFATKVGDWEIKGWTEYREIGSLSFTLRNAEMKALDNNFNETKDRSSLSLLNHRSSLVVECDNQKLVNGDVTIRQSLVHAEYGKLVKLMLERKFGDSKYVFEEWDLYYSGDVMSPYKSQEFINEVKGLSAFTVTFENDKKTWLNWKSWKKNKLVFPVERAQEAFAKIVDYCKS